MPTETLALLTSQYPDGRLHHRQRFMRALLALLSVLVVGTIGLLITEEDWSGWKALYFTLITITTVGYGDMGVSEEGQKFTIGLLVLGIATTTYAASQLFQAAIAYHHDWRSRMQSSIDQLSGHAIVCGAGQVGRTVCQQLLEQGKKVVLIDIGEDKLEWAQKMAIPLLVGCGTDDDVLRRAGIERAAGFVIATSSDPENIMICLSARDLRPDLLIVCRAVRIDSIRKLERAGATHVVAPAIDGARELSSIIAQPHLARFLRESMEAKSHFRMTAVPIEEGCELVGESPLSLGKNEPSLVFVAVQRPGQETQLRPRSAEPFLVDDIVIVVGHPEAVARLQERAGGMTTLA